MWRNGQILTLSVDHKPDREDESARITGAGGWVSNGRVLQTLAVSRALGDRDFKLLPRSAAASLPFTAPLVSVAVSIHAKHGSSHSIHACVRQISSEPEIRIERALEGDELLIACDGLWDVMSAEVAFQLLHSHGSESTPQQAVSQLVQAAEEVFHSTDNITALYVRMSSK